MGMGDSILFADSNLKMTQKGNAFLHHLSLRKKYIKINNPERKTIWFE